jgi:hypothetical protein
MRYCDGAGWLIGGRHELPSDPTECDTGQSSIRGCNRLRCGKCGQMVRSVPARVRDGAIDYDTFEYGALYALADLAVSPLLESSEDWRFYLCRCDCAHIFCETSCDDRDNPWGFPAWSCAGHPLTGLPRDTDGV